MGDEPEEGPLESIATGPDDPYMAAVREFDLGMDDAVAALKRIENAVAKIHPHQPGIMKAQKSIVEGLLPWLEQVDDDFTSLYPDMGEERKPR